jgi:hypothetical protein
MRNFSESETLKWLGIIVLAAIIFIGHFTKT